MLQQNLKHNHIATAALFCTALFFILYPPYSLITYGPFSWHISRPAFYQGITEAVIVFILVFFGMLVTNKWLRATAIILPCLYYSRRFGVDISIIVLYFYVQAIFSIGWHSLSILGIDRGTASHQLLASAICGVSIWSLVIWLMSSLAFHDFQTLLITLYLPLCLFLTLFRAPQLFILFHDSSKLGTTQEKAIHAAYLTAFLVLFAKVASSAPGYDTLWYGLSLKYVLLGKSGIYTDNGLVAFVHSYPKLYEALLIPLSGFGSASIPSGLAVYAMLFTGFTACAIMVGGGVKKSFALLVSLLAFSTPALGSIALTTKGDSFAAWMGLSAVFFLLRLRTSAKLTSFWLGTIAAIFSMLARLSMLPYAGLLIFFFTFSFFKEGFHRLGRGISAKSCVLPAVALAVTFLVLLRTYFLSGLLIVAPAPLVDLQERFGFMLKYPVGMIRKGMISQLSFPYVVWSYLFNISNF